MIFRYLRYYRRQRADW